MSSLAVNEIDEIIARAMAEYQASRNGQPVESEFVVEQSTTPTEPQTEQVETPAIPTNSPSLLIDESTSRFSDAIWYNKIQEKGVILAGLGGIGSYVAFLLSRLHISFLYLYDDDVVEEANMSGQLYSSYSIGLSKVNAISNILNDYSRYYSTYAMNQRFTASSDAGPIMICGFDNMQARRTFFESWLNHLNVMHDKSEALFIDGRLAAETFQVLCIRGDDNYSIERYQHEFLFHDSQADETICSYKQTTFMANMIGSVIVNLFVNFVANQCDPLIPRDLPFFTEYSADTMYFKVVA